jgi:hypothetical protein
VQPWKLYWVKYIAHIISYVTVTFCSLGQVEYCKEEAHHKVSLGGHGRCVCGVGGLAPVRLFLYYVALCSQKTCEGPSHQMSETIDYICSYALRSQTEVCSDIIATLWMVPLYPFGSKWMSPSLFIVLLCNRQFCVLNKYLATSLNLRLYFFLISTLKKSYFRCLNFTNIFAIPK